MKQAREEYKQLIEKLYTQKTTYRETKMCVFNAKKGKDYNGKLMIVGRAVNDWGDKTKYIIKDSDNQKAEFVESVLDYLETDTKNLKERMIVSKDEKYNPNKSAFTRLKRSLTAAFIPCQKSEANCNIVLSNLYKVSPTSGGNPSTILKSLQFEHSFNILKMEIEHYKPEVIIFLTSYQDQLWAKPFLDRLHVTNILQKPIGFVEFAGVYNNIKIVVGQHPQGRNENIHLKNILDALALVTQSQSEIK